MNATESFCNAPENRGNPLDSISGESDSSWTAACARECGVSEPTVVDVVGYYQEHHEKESASSGGAKMEVGIEKFARLMVSFKNAPKENYLLLYALDNRALDDVLGNLNASDFGHKFGCTKQAINKALSKIQHELHLPPRKDQRSHESRQKMSVKRNSTLTYNEK